MTGIELIAAERARQVSVEGWTADHDYQHDSGELAQAASCYAMAAAAQAPYETEAPPPNMPTNWPWDKKWWKPSDRIRNLAKAGALVAAEIDRLQRYI